MKISKYAALIKKMHFAIVVHTPDGIYLGTGASIYKAEGIPDMSGREQIGAVLDIEPKKLKKIQIEEKHSREKSNIWGLNLEDVSAASEQDAERLAVPTASYQCSTTDPGRDSLHQISHGSIHGSKRVGLLHKRYQSIPQCIVDTYSGYGGVTDHG